jgi:non-lysosomal glucosylceramidase
VKTRTGCANEPTTLRGAGLALAVVAALLLPALSANGAQAAHWSFETKRGPSLDGWKLVTDPSQAGPGLAYRGDGSTAPPFNPEGRGFLSSGETAEPGKESDGFVGTWQSPAFKLTRSHISLLARAQSNSFLDNGEGSWVAVCEKDDGQPRGCAELTRLQVRDLLRNFRLETIDVGRFVGRRVFLQVVDETSRRRITIDDVRVNQPLMPTHLRIEPGPKGPRLSWKPAADGASVARYEVLRSARPTGPWRKVATLKCAGKKCATKLVDRKAKPGKAWRYRVVAVGRDGSRSEPNRGLARAYVDPFKRGKPRVLGGKRLTALAFPVGGIGSSGILHLGDGRRNQGLIFNSYGTQHARTEFMIPNSFFAVRAKRPGGQPVVRALQTVGEGPFKAVEGLRFSGQYPFGKYAFRDPRLPVEVTESVYSPTIPGNTKDSAIPTAIYEFTFRNPGRKPVSVSLLATQQNPSGLDGESEVTGPDRRRNPAYGSNRNEVRKTGGRTRLELTGDKGGMALSIPGGKVSGTASWDSLGGLLGQFRKSGGVDGSGEAASPAEGVTVDGALSRQVKVPARGKKTVKVVLSWNFPERSRIFGGSGVQYSNWWKTAREVDDYVFARQSVLAKLTRRFRDQMYGSSLPRFVLDRITGNIATLRSPSMFWAENGFFGGWEGWGCCWNMPTHVWHYAQTHARLWPEIGRRFESQWLDEVTDEGLIPYRYDRYEFAIDGQLGVVLASYRDHLSSPDDSWLREEWPDIARAMDYVIEQNDADRDGVITGTALTTLDFPQSVDGPWIGSLYLAALDAASRMARIAGDPSHASEYENLLEKGRPAQEARYWRDGFFTPVSVEPENVPSQANGLDIDMLLGEWWASQLGLGPVYSPNRMKNGLGRLHRENFRQELSGANPYESYPFTARYRVFAEATDGGMIATTWPNGGQPKSGTAYSDEIWAGREYAAAAAMIDNGRVRDGLEVVRAVDDRYDGRLRNEPFMAIGPPGKWLETCNAGEGPGNPYGDVECGNWYGRSLSGWSLLLALQGFHHDGPAGLLRFEPRFSPKNHRSFFTAGDAWGQYSQKVVRGKPRVTLKLGYGTLPLRRLEVGGLGKVAKTGFRVLLGGRAVKGAKARFANGRLVVEFGRDPGLKAGTKLVVK